MYKINYLHQYTIDALQNFTFLRRTMESFKKILNWYKNVSSALLNGWNMTETSFDQACAGMEESCLQYGLGRGRNCMLGCSKRVWFEKRKKKQQAAKDDIRALFWL